MKKCTLLLLLMSACYLLFSFNNLADLTQDIDLINKYNLEYATDDYILTNNTSYQPIKAISKKKFSRNYISANHELELLIPMNVYHYGGNSRYQMFDFDWGDGQRSTVKNENLGWLAFNHVYQEDGAFDLSVRIRNYNVGGGKTDDFTMQLKIHVLSEYFVSNLQEYESLNNNNKLSKYNESVNDEIVLYIEGLDNSNDFVNSYVNNYFSQINTQETNLYFLDFADASNDLRLNALSVVKTLQAIHEIEGTHKPIKIVGYSMGGVVARFALAWMEENNFPHYSNLLITIDSPHRGVHVNTDLQNLIKTTTMASSGHPEIEEKLNALKSRLSSPAAMQMIRDNVYGDFNNRVTTNLYGSMESLFFYSYLSPIDRQLYIDGFGQNSIVPNMLNDDNSSHPNYKPGYPYKQNNISCIAISGGSLQGLETQNEYLSFAINVSSSIIIVGDLNVNGQVDLFLDDPACHLAGSKFYNIEDFDITSNLYKGIFWDFIDLYEIDIDYSLTQYYLPTFIPTFSSLDIQDFDVSINQQINPSINADLLNSIPVSQYFYMEQNHEHLDIQAFDQHLNNGLNQQLSHSHFISGNIVSNEGSPVTGSIITISDSNDNFLGTTTTDSNGNYGLPLNTLANQITIKAERDDFYSQYSSIAINSSQLEYSQNLRCMPIDPERLLVSERIIAGTEFFPTIDHVCIYLLQNYPNNSDEVRINLLSDISVDSCLMGFDPQFGNMKIILNGSNKKMHSSLELTSGFSSIQISAMNFIGANKAVYSNHLNNAEISFVSCNFENNDSAINLDNIQENNLISFKNCVFKNNTFSDTDHSDYYYNYDYLNTDSLTGVGGAIYINGINSSQNKVIIDNCSFSNNQAKVAGAVFVMGIPDLTISNCKFTNNYVNYVECNNIAYVDVSTASSLYIHKTSLNLHHNVFEETSSGDAQYPTFALLSLSENSNLYSLNNTYVNHHSAQSIKAYQNSHIDCVNDVYYSTGNAYRAVSSSESESSLINCLVYGFESPNPVFLNNSTAIDFITENPLLDDRYYPTWTLEQQSPCIEAGVRDLNGNDLWWFEDEEDQDVYGTRPEIGAMPSDMNGWGHVLPQDKVRWICFPYTLNDPNRHELSHYLQDVPISSIAASYQNNNQITQNAHVFGQKGFKITSSDDSKIDHFGKPVGSRFHYPSGNQIILSRLPFAEIGVNLIGYYKRESCNPMDAFQSLLDSGMIEIIKAEDWTIYYGAPQEPKGGSNHIGWHLISHTGMRPTLNFGEAVEVHYKGNEPYIEFNWSDGIPSVPKAITTKPSTFIYDEKENYLPMQVRIPEYNINRAEEPSGELGVYINGVCKGAGVISDSLVTVFAYIDSLTITENDTISFVIHDYQNSRSFNKFENYRVYDSNYESYVTKITRDINDSVVFFDLTSKEDQGNNVLPITTEIKSIYPNPFNPETTIEFNLKEGTDVNIKVYNLKGQLVKSVVNGKHEAGNHKVIWNGTNSNEQRVASGIYFCRMETKNKTVIKKMILMK